MPSQTATIIVFVGAVIGLAGWGLSLVGAWNAARWKRAELASAYLRELAAHPILVFACRALTWDGALLVVPNALRPLLSENLDFIEHDPAVIRQAMSPVVSLDDIAAEPRLQLYRTAVDDLLSWLGLVASALDRGLFQPDDVPEIGRWVMRIEKAGYLDDFIREFGHARTMDELGRAFSQRRDTLRAARALVAPRGGLGQTGTDRSAGG